MGEPLNDGMEDQLSVTEFAVESLLAEGFHNPQYRGIGSPDWRRHNDRDADDTVNLYPSVAVDGGVFIARIDGDMKDLPNLLAYKRVQGLVDALTQIKKGEGEIDCDPLQHAENVIGESIRIATDALSAFTTTGG